MRPHKLRGNLALVAMALVVFLSSTTFAQYTQTNLVSNVPGLAAVTDTNLVNAWGLANGPGSPWWISDNGTGLSTLYRGDGSIVPLVVSIPTPDGGTGSAPTGIVFNGSQDFVVSSNGLSGPAVFLFVTEDGTISGWNPGVSLHSTITVVDNSKLGSVYKGLAIAKTNQGSFLFAANFHSGAVEMYDTNFQLVKVFTDSGLPPHYAPFGIRAINGKIFVSFAKQDADAKDDVPGPGHGFVDVFDGNTGRKIQRLISGGRLNSPWGMVVAPANFGKLSGDLLVGNFGNGRINAYDAKTGAFIGTLKDANNAVVVIDGLWGLAFGNGSTAGPRNSLFFTAGPNGESNGLFGKLEAIP